MAAYYPRRVATFKDLKKLYPDLDTWDDDEEDRLEHIELYEHRAHRVSVYERLITSNRAKQRGKGAPKKRRTAAGTRCVFPKAEY